MSHLEVTDRQSLGNCPLFCLSFSMIYSSQVLKLKYFKGIFGSDFKMQIHSLSLISAEIESLRMGPGICIFNRFPAAQIWALLLGGVLLCWPCSTSSPVCSRRPRLLSQQSGADAQPHHSPGSRDSLSLFIPSPVISVKVFIISSHLEDCHSVLTGLLAFRQSFPLLIC